MFRTFVRSAGFSFGVSFLLGASFIGGASGCAGAAKQSVSLYEAGDYAGAARAADQGLAADPDDDDLLAMRIRAALAQGDAAAVASHYGRLQQAVGDDATLVDDLAIATLAQALESPSVRMKLVAIAAVEQEELHDLADLVAQRMEDRDDRVVAAAATAILRGYAQAPGALKGLLGSPDPEARAIAVDGVGRKVGALAVDDLRSAVTDEDARVRRAAIRWLGQLKDTQSVAVITRHTKDPDEAARAASFVALGRIGVADKALADKALADRSLAVRLAGVELLVLRNETSALAALAESDADPTVATEAAIAIKQRDVAKRQLARAIADARWTIRAGAANLAKRALERADALAVLAQLAKDPEIHVRLAAARALVTDDRALALEVLGAAFASPEHALAAAPDLARLGDPRGVLVLETTLQKAPKSGDRIAAIAAHRTARVITPWLVAALADRSGIVRAEAAAALVALSK